MTRDVGLGGAACPECEGRGWHVGECHPREECGTCDGTGRVAASDTKPTLEYQSASEVIPEVQPSDLPARSIQCPCGASSEISDSGVVSVQKASTTFVPYMNTRDGLTHTWICPHCDLLAKAAIGVLESVFRNNARYIYFGAAMASDDAEKKA